MAWVLTDAKSDLVKYPFTFFPLEPTEVRLKVFYAALCYSDSLHAREAWGIYYIIKDQHNILAARVTR